MKIEKCILLILYKNTSIVTMKIYKAYNIIISIDILNILKTKRGINIYTNSYYTTNTYQVNLNYINTGTEKKKHKGKLLYY